MSPREFYLSLIIRYAETCEKRWSRFERQVGGSWRVDETFIKVRGQLMYLYRAVDGQGNTVEFSARSAPRAQGSLRLSWPATIGRAPSDSWRCAPSRLALRPPAATPALGEWIALNERPRLRPARHPHRPSRAVARSPGLSKTSDRWWCPPQTRSEQCLESCNSRALRASGSRRPARGWTLEDRRNWPRVQRNGRWEMLWTLSVHNNSMGSVPIRSPNTILFSGHRCRSTS